MGHDLREHGRFVDHQTRAVHEIDGGCARHFIEKGEDFVAHETHEGFARHALGPDGPAEAVAGDGGLPRLGGV